MIARLAPRPRPARSRRDSGLASLELAILLPAFIALALLATLLGRRTIAQTQVDLAAHDAARAASIARTWQDAQTVGAAAADATLAAAGTPCKTLTVVIDVTQWKTVPLGQPATITANITCKLDLSDLAAPGFPGQLTITSSFSNPIDQYRSRNQT